MQKQIKDLIHGHGVTRRRIQTKEPLISMVAIMRTAKNDPKTGKTIGGNNHFQIRFNTGFHSALTIPTKEFNKIAVSLYPDDGIQLIINPPNSLKLDCFDVRQTSSGNSVVNSVAIVNDVYRHLKIDDFNKFDMRTYVIFKPKLIKQEGKTFLFQLSKKHVHQDRYTAEQRSNYKK